MADALARGVEIGRKYDPVGRFGFTGTHHPGVFCGQNYAKLCQAGRPDRAVQHRQLAGDHPFALPAAVHPDDAVVVQRQPGRLGHLDPLPGRRQGHHLLGQRGAENKFLSRPDGTPTERATSLGPTLWTIESGLGKLLYRQRPRQQRHRPVLLAPVDPRGLVAAVPGHGPQVGRDAQPHRCTAATSATSCGPAGTA